MLSAGYLQFPKGSKAQSSKFKGLSYGVHWTFRGSSERASFLERWGGCIKIHNQNFHLVGSSYDYPSVGG